MEVPPMLTKLSVRPILLAAAWVFVATCLAERQSMSSWLALEPSGEFTIDSQVQGRIGFWGAEWQSTNQDGTAVKGARQKGGRLPFRLRAPFHLRTA